MLDRLLVNWPLKLLALFLALAIWLSVTGETRILQDLRVPLDVQVGEDRILASEPPTTVTVRLRGPETSIRRLDALRLTLTLDLRQMSPGEREVQLTPANLRGVPSGVEVTLIDPSRINFVLERRLRRELPVAPDLIGEPDAGYGLYHAAVRPPVLQVEGPESEVQSLERLRTSPIRLDGHTTTFVQYVPVVPDRPHVGIVGNAAVEVSVTIDTRPVEKTFDGVPVVLGTARRGATVTPSSVSVTLAGPATLLDRLSASQLRAVADQPAPGEPGRAPLRVDLTTLPEEDRLRVSVKSTSRSHVAIRQVAAS
jgi:YbbR domain-containing protein